VPEDPADGPEADGHEEAQAAVDQLAARLDMSVLVEDRRQRPVWWATRGPVDATRVRTILNRRLDAPVARVVKTFDLANAVGPVRVPSMPELDMWVRWCVPLRAEGQLLGLLWVLDPDDRVSSGGLPAIVECAALAADVLARAEVSRRDVARRRNRLIRVLLRGSDSAAASELITVERLRVEARVQVDSGGRRGGWPLPAACGRTLPVIGRGPRPAERPCPSSSSPRPFGERRPRWRPYARRRSSTRCRGTHWAHGAWSSTRR
jgi:hypothetical protein